MITITDFEKAVETEFKIMFREGYRDRNSENYTFQIHAVPQEEIFELTPKTVRSLNSALLNISTQTILKVHSKKELLKIDSTNELTIDNIDYQLKVGYVKTVTTTSVSKDYFTYMNHQLREDEYKDSYYQYRMAFQNERPYSKSFTKRDLYYICAIRVYPNTKYFQFSSYFARGRGFRKELVRLDWDTYEHINPERESSRAGHIKIHSSDEFEDRIDVNLFNNYFRDKRNRVLIPTRTD